MFNISNNYQTFNGAVTLYGGRQGDLDGGTWHSHCKGESYSVICN